MNDEKLSAHTEQNVFVSTCDCDVSVVVSKSKLKVSFCAKQLVVRGWDLKGMEDATGKGGGDKIPDIMRQIKSHLYCARSVLMRY